jgi:hypothetical protein
MSSRRTMSDAQVSATLDELLGKHTVPADVPLADESDGFEVAPADPWAKLLGKAKAKRKK